MRSFIYLIFIGLLFSGCRSNDLITYGTTQNIKILEIDFKKFEYQTVFKFVTKKSKRIGFLFIDKKKEKVINFLQSKKGKFTSIEICQVHSIRIEDDLSLKSNRVFVKVSDNENPKRKYYTICHQQLKKIKNGL